MLASRCFRFLFPALALLAAEPTFATPGEPARPRHAERDAQRFPEPGLLRRTRGPSPFVDALRLVAVGRGVFRHDTFGNEVFWGDALRLHEALGRTSPRAALALGLKVDADALPKRLAAALRAGRVDLDDPANTVALLRLSKAGVDVIETAITPGSRAAGRLLSDIVLPEGTVIATLVRDGQPTVPAPSVRLRPGDELLLVSHAATEREIHAAFQ